MMKDFVKDYVGLYKHSIEFNREHMVGVFVANALMVGGTIVVLNKNKIKNKLNEKFKKDEVKFEVL